MLLAEQDRSLWDDTQIAQGRVSLRRAVALGGGGGPYALQAQIAALHTAPSRDWSQIAAQYGRLAALTGSAVVELNRAVALAETGDPGAALSLVEGLELDGYHYLHATRAELLRRLGRDEDARAAYERALELVHADSERSFLRSKLAELDAPSA